MVVPESELPAEPGRHALGILRDAYRNWVDDKAPLLGGAIAYAALFSTAPLIIIVVAIAGRVYGGPAARAEILGRIQSLAGLQVAAAVNGLVESASRPTSGLLAGTFALVVLLLGALGVVGLLQQALNQIWKAEARPPGSLWQAVLRRLPLFLTILVAGALLLASLATSIALAALGRFLSPALPSPAPVLQALDLVAGFTILTVLFAAIYKVLPDIDLAWADVWAGAAITSALFNLGQLAISIYLAHAAVGSAYGAAASLVVLLVWVYWSAQVFLFGAEFTHVYWVKHGSGAQRPRAGVISLVRYRLTRRGERKND